MKRIHCHHCGSEAENKRLAEGQALRCGLCKSVVKIYRHPDAYQRACALAVCGLVFLLLANFYPIMDFSVAGNQQSNWIITGIGVLVDCGYWPIAVLVFLCAMLAPTAHFFGVAYSSVACFAWKKMPFAPLALRAAKLAQPWSLLPVFAAACLVSAVKLELIGEVSWKAGVWWTAALALDALLLGSIFDAEDAERILAGEEETA